MRAIATMLLRDKQVKLAVLEELLKLPSDLIYDLLKEMPVAFHSDSVIVTDPAEFILICWGKGIDPIDLALKAGWRDFEQLCSRILEKLGFQTITNVRFKIESSVRELDVLAFREPRVLAMDCKKWVRRRESSLKSAARAHKERCMHFARSLVNLREVLLIVSRWREAKLYPVVVDIHETATKVFEGVPIVPFRKLISFVNELENFEDEIYSISINFERVDKIKWW